MIILGEVGGFFNKKEVVKFIFKILKGIRDWEFLLMVLWIKIFDMIVV